MSNEERILRWRESRLKAADDAKQERLDEIKRRRTEDDLAEAERRRELASELLPNSETLELARQRLVDARRAKTLRQRWRNGLVLGLPTVLTAAYFLVVATPLYETRAIFAVQTATEQPSVPTAGIFSLGAPASTLTDAFSTREFMLSPEMLRALDTQNGFTAHFRAPGVDPLTRPHVLSVFGIDEYSFFRRRVHVDIDVQANLLTLSVQARSPDDAVRFAVEMIGRAQRRINQLADDVSADRIASLTRTADAAETAFRDALLAITAVQARRSEIAPEQTAATYYQVIGSLEAQAADVEGRRESLLGNGLTESPLLPKLSVQLAELRRQISEQRARLANPKGSGLQNSASQLEAVTIRRDLARDKWQSALRTLEQARLSGLDHKRYLVMVARPLAPRIATVNRWPYAVLLVLVLVALSFGLAAVVRLLGQVRRR